MKVKDEFFVVPRFFHVVKSEKEIFCGTIATAWLNSDHTGTFCRRCNLKIESANRRLAEKLLLDWPLTVAHMAAVNEALAADPDLYGYKLLDALGYDNVNDSDAVNAVKEHCYAG